MPAPVALATRATMPSLICAVSPSAISTALPSTTSAESVCAMLRESSSDATRPTTSSALSPVRFSKGTTATRRMSMAGPRSRVRCVAYQAPTATTTMPSVITATRVVRRVVDALAAGYATRLAAPMGIVLLGVDKLSSAFTSSCAPCGRSAADLAMHRCTNCASAGGVAGRNRSTGVASSVMCAAIVACGERPANGFRPHNISYATTPSA